MHRKHQRIHSMYELDKSEIQNLLDHSTEKKVIVDANPLDMEGEIRCSRCGFGNPCTAMVCRECNNLLKGGDLLSTSFTNNSNSIFDVC